MTVLSERVIFISGPRPLPARRGAPTVLHSINRRPRRPPPSRNDRLRPPLRRRRRPLPLSPLKFPPSGSNSDSGQCWSVVLLLPAHLIVASAVMTHCLKASPDSVLQLGVADNQMTEDLLVSSTQAGNSISVSPLLPSSSSSPWASRKWHWRQQSPCLQNFPVAIQFRRKMRPPSSPSGNSVVLHRLHRLLFSNGARLGLVMPCVVLVVIVFVHCCGRG